MAKKIVGRVGMIPKGAFVPGSIYRRMDVVTNQGNSYLSMKDGNNSPLTDTVDWLLIAKKGDVGDVATTKSLSISDPKPTVQGLYILNEIGTYGNLGNVANNSGTVGPVVTKKGYISFYSHTTQESRFTEIEIPVNITGVYDPAQNYVGPVSVYLNNRVYFLPADKESLGVSPEGSVDWQLVFYPLELGTSISSEENRAVPGSVIKTELDKKVDKVEGKGLSTNDFTNTQKDKVDKLIINGEGKGLLKDDGEYLPIGSLGGGGFYNVTTKAPLENDYYTIETAIAVVAADQDIDPSLVKGLIITFESADNVWSDFRYVGDNLSGLGTLTNWVPQTVRNVVKSIRLQQGVNVEELTPDSSGNVNITIPQVIVDDTLSEGGTNPVEGGAIYTTIQQSLAGLGASIRLNTVSEGTYSLSLLNSEGEVIETTESFSGGGGGGSGGPTTNNRVVLTKITDNPTVKGGTQVKLQYSYDQVDSTTNQSTGNGATAVITVTRGSTTNSYTTQVVAGSSNTIDVTQYLAVGASTVKVKITTNDELQQVTSISWVVTVVELKLESSFNIATNTVKGQSVTIPYALTGAGTKTLRLYVDGNLVDDKVITSSTSTGSFTFNTSSLNHGTHSFQMLASLEVSSGNTIISNSIFLGVIITEASKTTPVFGTRFDYADGTIIGVGQQPYISTKQYANYNVIYACYDPLNGTTATQVIVDDKVISSTNVQFVRTVVTSRSFSINELVASLKCRTTTYLFKVNVSPLDVSITEPTDGLLLKLTTDGRTNNDVNRLEWKYNTIDTLLENFSWGGNGWIDNALRLTGEAKATINFFPLSQDVITNNSMTFTVKFKVSNLTDENFAVIKCLDVTGTGFIITGQDAKMVTKGNSSVVTKFASGEDYTIGFVSFPTATPESTSYEKRNSGMVYLYVNGIMSGAVQRGSSDNIYQSPASKLVMEVASKCTLDVYSIRHYNRYLSDDEMLNAYLIDLTDTDILLDKFNQNNILDQTGNISIQSLPAHLPYMIITGVQENGVPTVLQAAVNNNKSTKYNVDEILYVNPSNTKKNFKVTDGAQIQLQGTSSLAYPVKNYKIKFENVSKVAGTLRTGVDAQGNGGTVQPNNLYSFKDATPEQKAAAPVALFCLKADYAESSSSHNTGVSKIVHEVFKSAGELTPAQKKVSSSHPYDVRTTIDGFPMILFYRATVNDTPKFLGKFNFNNDKGTEDVFGFLNIPGYHDQPWVTDKFSGVNPTECWEFLNNDYPMGSFTDDDFDAVDTDGTRKWTKVFEARFPDSSSKNAQYAAGTARPYYLERLVKWVKSTQTDVAKFKTELADYFDVNFLCDYYVMTEVLGAVDQRVKNMMFGFWYNPDVDKMLCYPIFYDNDTILGVRNDGKLKYSWDIDHNTIDPELSTAQRTVYAYAGRDSVLWKNLRSQFADEIASAYVRLRTRMSNDYLFRIFDTEQSSKFVERIYNIDAINKYVIPATEGIPVVQNGQTTVQTYSYLEAMQGSRLAHRHWWLINRLNLLDARFNTGLYRATDLTFKGNSAAGASIKVTAARQYYFAFVRESATLANTLVQANGEFTYTYPQEANIGTIFHLYGGDWAKKIDLSNWGGFTSISIPRLKVLEELILGNSTRNYILPSITIGDSLPLLKKIDLTNYTVLSTLDLSGCQTLEKVIATGCTSLTNIKLYDGAPITELRLPSNYTNLVLKGLSKLQSTGIYFDNIANLSYLWIDNCPLINPLEILDQALAINTTTKRYVRFEVNITDNGTLIRKWMNSNLGGISTSGGNLENTISIYGTYQLTRYIEDAEYNEMVAKFPLLNLKRPMYTKVRNDWGISDPKSLTNLENETGYLYGNTYKPSGHITKILNGRFKLLAKRVNANELLYYKLHDDAENKYADAVEYDLATPASLAGTEGEAMMYEPKYWYKGVNDVLNKVNYTIVAYDQPENPVVTVLLENQMVGDHAKLVSKSIVASTSNLDLTTSTVNDPTSVVFKIKLSPSNKLIRFQAVLGEGNLGAVFVDELGTVIKRVVVPPNNTGYYPGSYVVSEIPSGCSHLYFTKNKDTPFDKVVISNNLLIEDLEPDWVVHDKALVGLFTSTGWVSRASGGHNDNWQFNYYLADTYAGSASASPYSVTDFDEYNHIANLFLLTYGSRDQRICGGTVNSTGAQFGWGSVPKGNYGWAGMRNTYSSNGINTKLKTISGGVEVEVDWRLPNTLGYEAYMLPSISVWTPTTIKNSRYSGYKAIDNKDGITIDFKNGSGYVSSIIHGKHCINLANSFAGSATTYYPDSSNTSYSNYIILPGGKAMSSGGVYTTAFEGGEGIFSISTGYPGGVCWRIMVRNPNLTKALSVNAFKNFTGV